MKRYSLPFPLLSCESWMFVKENPDRKKQQPGKQLQYTQCSISQEVKTIWQWNLVSSQNTIWQMFSFKKHAKNEAEDLFQTFFFVFFVCFFFKKHSITSKQVVSNIVLIYLGGPPHEHTIKSNCITSQTVDPEIFSISILYNRVWYWLHHHILCMIFQEKYFLWDILLPD